MGIKLKNIRYSLGAKAFAVLLTVGGVFLVAFAMMKVQYLQYISVHIAEGSQVDDPVQLQYYRDLGQYCLYELMSGTTLFLTGVLHLIYSAGRRSDTEGVQLIWCDRMYLDIGALLVLPSVVAAALLVFQLWSAVYPVNAQLFFIMSGVLIFVSVLLAIMYGTSVVKRLKRREFIRHTLAVSSLLWLIGPAVRVTGEIWRRARGSSLRRRTFLYFIGFSAAVLMAVILWFVLGNAMGPIGVLAGAGVYMGIHLFAAVFVLRRISSIESMVEGTGRIRGGEMNYRLSKTGEALTDTLTDNINSLAEGLRASVESEVRAERMKAELVTNVSHDLKTPLTSIITYIDLLKTEGICSENAPQYLEILDQKSQRLKTLTEDLFEAAKASSGSIPVNSEKLDIGDFVAQGMGEMADRIADSGLDFRISLPESRVYAYGDGRLLWRVMENLFSNVFKYAQPNSRVYLDISGSDEWIRITLKNISAFALNVAPDELMERFTRGDASRSSEGSGLGLSITQSLLALQGGRFEIVIDGDLFKVMVDIPRQPMGNHEVEIRG